MAWKESLDKRIKRYHKIITLFYDIFFVKLWKENTVVKIGNIM
ncbi:MAG: hypothetical protein ACI4F9_05510 [Lachnospiraceae bacterium]